MRTLLAFIPLMLVLAAVPGQAQQPKSQPLYKLTFDRDRDLANPINEMFEGKMQMMVTVSFTITPLTESPGGAWKDYKILIKESGQLVKTLGIPPPEASEDLSVILAMDISGSMQGRRIEQARAAAAVFLNQLPARADCGLILFDHEMKVVRDLTKDRRELLDLVRKTEPAGGTAWIDAAKKGIEMLIATAKTKGKALVVVTDGLDLNSKAKLQEVIDLARRAGIRVYTIGIGEPGRKEPVTTVLALDRSGSMLDPANDTDKTRKIDDLKAAASRFVEIMREKARTTIMEFSDQVKSPDPFSGDKHSLQAAIKGLTPGGETAFLDAAYTALMALGAEDPLGKRAVVVLTDGIDNSSRRRKDEVIARALEMKIPIHMLGFGRPGELDRATMEEVAKKTGGQFHHAVNQKKLMEIFEKLSIDLHDDGIDEVSLKKLATETGGQYFAAKDVSGLKLLFSQVGRSILERQSETFASLNQRQDGTVRPVTLELVRGDEVIQIEIGTTQVRGVVVPEMNNLVYLVLLGILGVLLALPTTMRRLTRTAGS